MWSCAKCLVKHHRIDHEDCHKVEKKLKEGSGEGYFSLLLTRFDGQVFSTICRRGMKLEMEDHWLGTYIFFPATLILVVEDRKTINERILQALQESQ